MSALTVAALLREARARLGNRFSSALDARLLLQAAVGLTHEQIVADPEREIPDQAADKFLGLLARRLAHEPVSRILGRREFYGRNFEITPDVLDPRADTETLITMALEHCPPGTRFLDLGTGSGAIAVTLCAEGRNFTGLATDISAAALTVARANAYAAGVADKIAFQQAKWFEGVEGIFDLVISNPPYVKDGCALMPDVERFDPHLALFGGNDGLDAYRAIAAGAVAHLASAGKIIVEIGMGQVSDVCDIFAFHGLGLSAQAEDLADIPRALLFRPNLFLQISCWNRN